ncbi:methyltransferase domain-containing protein [Streptomyces sp. NPDC127091]|uniref:methyltransferase domain-containing protein n=1 Tax=Streptomyces sp. NPDC127091 TaxID=3347134 RepID=UPI0036488EBB
MAGAYDLPLPDTSVGAYRADQVFHEPAEPEGASAETRRVLAPEGRITLIGRDWDTIVIDSDDPALPRAVVHARASLIAGPRSARRYRSPLLDTGFDDVTVEGGPPGGAPPRRWPTQHPRGGGARDTPPPPRPHTRNTPGA